MKIQESWTPHVPHFGVHQQTGVVHGLEVVEIMESSSKSIHKKTIESENYSNALTPQYSSPQYLCLAGLSFKTK